MFLSRFFGRQDVRSTRRSQPDRRPLVEALEGRQLLSTFTVTKGVDAIQGNHIGAPAIVGQHIGTPAIVGQHIGTPAIVGQHIGSAAIQGNHIGSAAIQGNHIGAPAIVGQHIGTNVVDAVVSPGGGVARKH
jgi:hypothetical protein